MTPTAQEVVTDLTTQTCPHDREVEKLRQDCMLCLTAAFTTFAHAREREVSKEAEKRCQLVHPNPRCLKCRQTIYPGEDGYRCFDCREWFCVEHARIHFKADLTDCAKQLLAEERRAVWEEAAKMLCDGCRFGEPIEVVDGIEHHRRIPTATEPYTYPCDPGAIEFRRRATQAEGKEERT